MNKKSRLGISKNFTILLLIPILLSLLLLLQLASASETMYTTYENIALGRIVGNSPDKAITQLAEIIKTEDEKTIKTIFYILKNNKMAAADFPTKLLEAAVVSKKLRLIIGGEDDFFRVVRKLPPEAVDELGFIIKNYDDDVVEHMFNLLKNNKLGKGTFPYQKNVLKNIARILKESVYCVTTADISATAKVCDEALAKFLTRPKNLIALGKIISDKNRVTEFIADKLLKVVPETAKDLDYVLTKEWVFTGFIKESNGDVIPIIFKANQVQDSLLREPRFSRLVQNYFKQANANEAIANSLSRLFFNKDKYRIAKTALVDTLTITKENNRKIGGFITEKIEGKTFYTLYEDAKDTRKFNIRDTFDWYRYVPKNPEEYKYFLTSQDKELVEKDVLWHFILGNTDPNLNNYVRTADGKIAFFDFTDSLGLHQTDEVGDTFFSDMYPSINNLLREKPPDILSVDAGNFYRFPPQRDLNKAWKQLTSVNDKRGQLSFLKNKFGDRVDELREFVLDEDKWDAAFDIAISDPEIKLRIIEVKSELKNRMINFINNYDDTIEQLGG